MTKTNRFIIRSVLACVLGLALLSSTEAATYRCTIKRMRGNDFVCREYPNLLSLIHI